MAVIIQQFLQLSDAAYKELEADDKAILFLKLNHK